jgi:hypothetical protein
MAMIDREMANSMIPGPIATYIGRKSSLYLAVLLIYVANGVMMTTDSIGGLYAGRLIMGLGNGFLMTFSQLYIQVCQQFWISSMQEKVLQRTYIYSRNALPPATAASC